MNEIKIEDIYQLKYSVKVLNSIKQIWRDNDTYNFIGNKKKQHLFLFFLNCNATIKLKNGEKIFAPNDSIIYIPEESEYEIIFSNCDVKSPYNSISVNFKLYDQEGIPFAFSNEIKIFNLKEYPQIHKGAAKIADSASAALKCPMRTNGLFYLLVSDISSFCHINEHIIPKYNVIAEGIKVLENGCDNQVKINDLAKMCNVSPMYFRKLFKEYAGVTPVEYKLNSMISQAKQYLIFSQIYKRNH
jgi:AraC-like DNA-binding protein